MQQRDVLEVLAAFDRAEIRVLLEGGWAIDALVGQQTRDHRDLDLVVDRDDLSAAAHVLAGMAFSHDSDRRPGIPAQLIMVDTSGREVDVHPVMIDDAGNRWQQLSYDDMSRSILRAIGRSLPSTSRCPSGHRGATFVLF